MSRRLSLGVQTKPRQELTKDEASAHRGGGTDFEVRPLRGVPVVGRQWSSIPVAVYATKLVTGAPKGAVLPMTERERRFIGYIVDSWLEDWWKKTSQE